MTKFEELQQVHQQLLDRMDEVSDKAEFAREVQGYIARVCDEAVDVPAPRDRDQLRANLRFWASYVYDVTGTYPNTTMRPAYPSAATPVESTSFAPPPVVPAPAAPSIPPPAPAPMPRQAPATSSRTSTLSWRTGVVAVIAVLLIGLLYLWARANPTGLSSAARPGAIVVQPTAIAPSKTLTVTWRMVTNGPSPFNPNIWAAKIELSAAGGNGEYIFWANGQRLPDVSDNQFTVESQGCQPVTQFIGVTSDGQSARQELIIYPPDSSPCSR
jgi:hypothetical protein